MIILLSTINSEPKDSNNYKIANSILTFHMIYS